MSLFFVSLKTFLLSPKHCRKYAESKKKSTLLVGTKQLQFVSTRNLAILITKLLTVSCSSVSHFNYVSYNNFAPEMLACN